MTDDELRRMWAKHAPNIGGTLDYAREVYAIAHRAGLEHAADEAIDIVARHGGSVEIEAAIRERLRPDHFVDVNQMVQPTQEQGATS